MISNVTGAETIQALTGAKTLAEGHAVVQRALSAFGLKHFSYLSVSPTPRQKPLVVTTYVPEWQRRYHEQNYIRIDPVVALGARSAGPFDWGRADLSERRVRDFFGEAREHDLGRHGITFPFRGPCGAFALFSANADGNLRDWRMLRERFTGELLVVSAYFHAWANARASDGDEAKARLLSVREKECLAWCAGGKSIWDISAILGVSERTVRFHLAGARRKLDASNTIHAIAKAIQHGAIELP